MYPDTIVPREALHRPVNNFATLLTAGINATQQSIPIATKQIGSTQLPPAGMISIDNEVIYYGAINPVGPQLINCLRGFDGTAPAAHSSGSRAEVRWVAGHHNALADLLYTVQVVLGAGLLTASDQLGGSATYADLATKLRSTLPDVRPVSPSSKIWTVQHLKKRVVGVQLYEYDPNDQTYRLFEAPVEQVVDATGPGASTVTVEPFAEAKEGVIVLL